MKMSEIKSRTIRAEKGEWWALPELDMQVFVKGLYNRNFRRMQAELRNQYLSRKIRGDVLTEEEGDEINAKCVVETVLLDWRGLEDDEKNPIPFDKEISLILMTDPDYEIFRAGVMRVSGALAAGLENDLENDRGNSKRASSGTSNGGTSSRISRRKRRQARA
jgi:hypothetical protein